MKKKVTPAAKLSQKIDWSKNQLSKNELKQILGGTDNPPPCHPGSVTDDPFSKRCSG
jgi:bacteriocin-like protein